MTPTLTVVVPTGPLYRVGRAPDPWGWPDWSFAGADGTFGNRFDDPRGEYRVLYASSSRVGALVEVLARFRVDPALVAEYALIDDDEDGSPAVAPGVVPAEWLRERRIGAATHAGGFADIGQADSLAHLRAALAARLVHYGLDDLDGSDIRRRAPRAFTQEISRYVFEHGTDNAGAPLAGIRYLSRLGDDVVNWAIFEPMGPEHGSSAEIARDNEDLAAALGTLGVHLDG